MELLEFVKLLPEFIEIIGINRNLVLSGINSRIRIRFTQKF